MSSAVLEGAGYDVIDATNEDEALAICGRADQRINAMVSDVILSSASGTDVAERITLLRLSLPILFVSGFGMSASEFSIGLVSRYVGLS